MVDAGKSDTLARVTSHPTGGRPHKERTAIVGTLYTGDQRDDDATIIDETVSPHGDVDTVATDHVVLRETPLPPPVSALRAGGYAWPIGTTTPLRVVPADPERTALLLRVRGTTTSTVWIAESPDSLHISGAAFAISSADAVVEIPTHTGPVYAALSNADSTDVSISYLAVHGGSR